jgi:hypothetical protein
MAQDTTGDMNGPRRHVHGPRPIGALVPAIARAAFRRRAPGTAQVLADWPNIVGPALAAVTIPRRLSAGTLTITCSGPIAMELQHLSGELIQRINTALGGRAVTALRFSQVTQAAPAPPPAPQVDPEAARRAESAVEGLPDDGLRTALAALGRTVFTASANMPRQRRVRGDKPTTS